MEWEQRDASDEDKEFLFELHRLALGPYIEKTWGWDETWQRDNFNEQFAAAGWKVLTVDQQPVGAFRTAARDGELYLEDILILPAFQRKGLGTAVIESLAGVAKSAGTCVRLQVLKVNPAIALYTRLGFRVIGEDDAHYQMRRETSRD